MTEHVERIKNYSKKTLLFMAGSMTVVVPVLIGAVSAPVSQAQAAAAPANEAHARGDIAGNWQGTLEAGQPLRIIFKVSKTDKGWSAQMYSIDQGIPPINASVTLDGSTFKSAVDLIGANYQGALSADGNSIVGSWTQGPNTLPLTLIRATRQTAWEIPAPPPPPKLMAADADPSFDVATIKPNNSGEARLQGLSVNGRNFTTRNSSLSDLITFAYNVQTKQIVNGPDWLDKDRYDIAAVPDQEGDPNIQQLRIMVRKLLADRFKLTFHHDKRDLSAFVLTVGKNGEKLKPTQLRGSLPGLGLRSGPTGLTLIVVNGKMSDFTSFLQMLILDRPVVDQTGIQGNFDFSFTFTGDDSLFGGHPPPNRSQVDTANAAPGFFEAIQQQIGLKLNAQKTPVDVIAIDHVEKPSAN